MESMSAAVLFIPDQSEITHLETADYRASINGSPSKNPDIKTPLVVSFWLGIVISPLAAC